MSDPSEKNVVRCENNRRGVALLVVLFIVSIVSILALGFAVKADTELLCGKNVEFRMEMDYLSLTALNYAKTLIKNPQDVTTGPQGYWQGDKNLQIEAGDDYFDIEVVQSASGDTPESTYNVSCQAYRLDGSAKISETKILAQLRLDPCIAYWSGSTSAISANMTIFGDVYCNGDFSFTGTVNGDVYAGIFQGWKTGQLFSKSQVKVVWPGIDASRFETGYYIDSTSYNPISLVGDVYTGDFALVDFAFNPAGIYYHRGALELNGNCNINGTLIVDGDLTFKNSQITIASMKNQPAIVVNGKLLFENSGAKITGLVQAKEVTVLEGDGDLSGSITITGGLFIKDKGIDVDNAYSGSIIVRGDPMKASIKMISSSSELTEWSPVGGAYYKYIRRQ